MSMWRVLAFLFLVGCSSSSGKYMMPESDFGHAEGFTFRKEQTDRRNWKPWQFYYKDCASTGNESYYSKTSYQCSGPYY